MKIKFKFNTQRLSNFLNMQGLIPHSSQSDQTEIEKKKNKTEMIINPSNTLTIPSLNTRNTKMITTIQQH